MRIELLTKYDKKTADRVRELLIQLSRSGKDRGEIPETWFEDLINSSSHDMLLAYDNNGKIVALPLFPLSWVPS